MRAGVLGVQAMSNARAAMFAYLAQVDRDKARVFRNFGYHASARVIEARARRHESNAILESKEAPQDEPYGASRASHPTELQTSDLHRTSEGDQEPGLF